MPRPDRHHCPGLQNCENHMRWFVARTRAGWGAYLPRSGPFDIPAGGPFATHDQAVRYATTRARAQLHDAIQNQPSEVCS